MFHWNIFDETNNSVYFPLYFIILLLACPFKLLAPSLFCLFAWRLSCQQFVLLGLKRSMPTISTTKSMQICRHKTLIMKEISKEIQSVWKISFQKQNYTSWARKKDHYNVNTWPGGIPWRHNHLDGEQKLVRGDNVIKTVTVVGVV